jgi:hypothetical protein
MRIRINQIECRFSQGRYEIIKWQPNCYYGKKQEYLDNGYEEVNGFLRYNNLSIQATFFDREETCYTVATLTYDADEYCCDMRTVGPRLLELSKAERADFFAVYEYAEGRIREEAIATEEEEL